jgi:hypothetical protein
MEALRAQSERERAEVFWRDDPASSVYLPQENARNAKMGLRTRLHSLQTTNASASVGLSASAGFADGGICLL